MGSGAILVWFRRDLRLADNPALAAAAATGSSVIPVFIWSPEEEGRWAPGSASRWWLHQSLVELDAALRKRGSRLIVRRGPSKQALLQLAASAGARSVYWNQVYEPAASEQSRKIKETLAENGLEHKTFSGNVLFEPGSILNRSGRPFTVFTAFWNTCLGSQPAEPVAAPRRMLAPSRWPESRPLSELALEPKIDWAAGMRKSWRPGERGAAQRLKRFLEGSVTQYSSQRDRPDDDGTSRLSPHLHFGEISARQIWHAARNRRSKSGTAYLRQIAWREFAHHLLFHFPQTCEEPLRPEFRRFPWKFDAKALRAWTRGKTGYPLVDAGMRELWHSGWMHNRVRMVAASFLVKHLLIPWQEGAAWFWDTLVDADLANNTLGWQWVAGCGADAAPYFRIFNPVMQGEKFDPEGAYVRRWVPELAQLPDRWVHKPWQAPPAVLKEAGITLGETYPFPIVEHEKARKRALEAFARMRGR